MLAAAWTTPVPTALPSNNAGIHATVLHSGAVAVAYNNMSGEAKHDLRNVLAISISDDGGATFPTTRLLEKHPPSALTTEAAAEGELRAGGIGPTSCDCYSYPTMAQAEDGTIHIAYTYQRRTIKVTAVTEAWVRAAEGPLCQ